MAPWKPFFLVDAMVAFNHAVYLGKTRATWLNLPVDELVGLEIEKPDAVWLRGLPDKDPFEGLFDARAGA